MRNSERGTGNVSYEQSLGGGGILVVELVSRSYIFRCESDFDWRWGGLCICSEFLCAAIVGVKPWLRSRLR